MKYKKLIEDTIFHEIDYDAPIPFSTIKDIIEDNDTISAGWEEGHYSENNSMDGHYFINVTRTRFETDKEHDVRLVGDEKDKERMRQNRYETYMKLKEEFYPGVS